MQNKPKKLYSHVSKQTIILFLFNDIPVARTNCLKNLGMHVDNKLNFNQHIEEKISEVNKGIGITRKLNKTLHCRNFTIVKTLQTLQSKKRNIYSSFVRNHLDYCDIIYDTMINPATKVFVTKTKE